MNGYIGLYNGKQYEVYADTSFEAQSILAKQLKVKGWKIAIYLCEKDGKEVINTTI